MPRITLTASGSDAPARLEGAGPLDGAALPVLVLLHVERRRVAARPAAAPRGSSRCRSGSGRPCRRAARRSLPPPCSVRRRIVDVPSFASSLLATAGCHFARLLNPPIASHTVRAGTGSVVDRLTLAMKVSSVAGRCWELLRSAWNRRVPPTSEPPASGGLDEPLLVHPERDTRAHRVDRPHLGVELPGLVLRHGTAVARRASSFALRTSPGHAFHDHGLLGALAAHDAARGSEPGCAPCATRPRC